MATFVDLVSNDPAPPLPTCIMLNNVPLEQTTDDIYNVLRDKAGIPSVLDVRIMSDSSTGKNYALASISNVNDIPASVQLEYGLPDSLVTVIFQELVTAEFVLNENLLTTENQRQIIEEGYKLSVSLSFSQAMTVSVTGSCNQVYKFRQYLTKLLTHTALTINHPQYNTPRHSQYVITNIRKEEPFIPQAPRPHAALPPPKEETGRSFTGLSRDVLLLMSKQVDTFKGMTFHPDEGRVEILANLSEEEQEQCIAKLQQSYQDITKNRQVKSGDLQVPSSFSPEQLVSLFEEFNEKYNQCHFSHDDKNQTIRIVSMSPRQYNQAKKLISDRLHGIGASKIKHSTAPTSGSQPSKTTIHLRSPTVNKKTNEGETDYPGCPICLNKRVSDPVYTNCCKQVFCRSCFYQSLNHSCYCPICKTALRPVQGNQPIGGTMDCKASPLSLPGYEKWGSITINYYIPSGVQGPEHPNPGTRYHGTSRTAYLPNNAEGQEVLGLLKRAFDARLIFTIGTSHTTSTPNAVVWNDIHHKTSIRGQSFGYPDPTYLQRVKEELKAKGIQ